MGAQSLEALKIVELELRLERPEVHAALAPKALHLLHAAHDTPLEPQDNILEMPFVFPELRRLFRSLRVLLHPTLCGPYLLELSDPLGKLLVEWDANWTLYPPWRRTRHKEFVLRKHRHLRAEGWRVLHVPIDQFRALPDDDAKRAFLRDFISQNDLDYLSMAGLP